MEFSENVARLRPSATMAVSALAKELRGRGEDIINLSAGEPDFGTPGWICDAAVRGIEEGGTRYTPASGLPELRSAVAESLHRLGGQLRRPRGEEVVVSCGAKHSLFNACFTLFGPGDEVLVASPYWTSHGEIVSLARGEPVYVSGPEERSFRLTPSELEAASTPATRGLILCSPSNPTGTVYSVEELRAVAEWARERDVVLISDEIYRSIYFGSDNERERAPSLIDLPPDSVGEFVLVDGVSKSFAMTGWRIGFTWSSEAVASKMAALQSQTTSNPATPSQLAALEALGNVDRGAAEGRRSREIFRRRRDLVIGLLEEKLPQLSYVPPEGAFYLFLRVDGTYGGEVVDSRSWCRWLLESEGVAVVPGVAFGDDRFVRLSFAASEEALAEAVARLTRALAARDG